MHECANHDYQALSNDSEVDFQAEKNKQYKEYIKKTDTNNKLINKSTFLGFSTKLEN